MNTKIEVQKSKVAEKQKIYDENYKKWQVHLEYSNKRSSELRSSIHSNGAYKGVTVWIAICLGIAGFVSLWHSIIITGLCFAGVYGLIALHNQIQGFIDNHESVITENEKKVSEAQSNSDASKNRLDEDIAELARLEEEEKVHLETLERDIEEYGHKEAIKVSKHFKSMLGLEKPINNINSLFRKYDQDNEIYTEQNNPIVAIREKAESLNNEFRGMMHSVEDEYKKFCDFGTHDIAHEIGEIEPDDYFRISKHLETQMIHAIEVQKANKELSQHIEKLDKQINR